MEKNNRNTPWTPPKEGVDLAIKDCYTKLEKLYPNINLKDKYILIIQNQINFPFSYIDIDINIKLNSLPLICDEFLKKFRQAILNNGVYEQKIQNAYPNIFNNVNSIDDYISNTLQKNYIHINNIKDLLKSSSIMLRNPYSNKNIVSTNLKKNDEVFKYGIPLIFNSFEDMQKLKDIDIIMKFLIGTEKCSELTVKYSYLIQYIENTKSIPNLYVLNANNIVFSPDKYRQFIRNKIDDEVINTYINNFNMIAYARNHNDQISIEYIKGSEDDKFIKEEGLMKYIGEFIDTTILPKTEHLALQSITSINPCNISYDFIVAE